MTGEVIDGPGDLPPQPRLFDSGEWQFEEISITPEGLRVGTNMRVANAVMDDLAHALTFQELADEYRPDSYDALAWRKGLVRINRDNRAVVKGEAPGKRARVKLSFMPVC